MKLPYETQEKIRKKYQGLEHLMNERIRRMWAASEALSFGNGGIACVSRATGINPNTISKGIRELIDPRQQAECDRVRKSGAGAKKLTEIYPDIEKAIGDIVDSDTRGDPESPLKWTTKSVAHIARELKQQGYEISGMSVWSLLRNMGYSLRAVAKEDEGAQHPDRNAQFEHINDRARQMTKAGQPVISIDTKKKEGYRELCEKRRRMASER